jgi:hypothetical protein
VTVVPVMVVMTAVAVVPAVMGPTAPAVPITIITVVFSPVVVGPVVVPGVGHVRRPRPAGDRVEDGRNQAVVQGFETEGRTTDGEHRHLRVKGQR